MLDQVILCGTVHTDIGENFTNDIQLMVAGENEVFRPLYLAGPVIDRDYPKVCVNLLHGVE